MTTEVAKKEKSTAVTTWQDRMAAMAKAAVETEASVAGGKFLSTRSGVLSYDGNACKDNKVDVVIVDYVLENAYYIDRFDSDNPSPPVCYAFGRDNGDMRPHPKASQPQHETCKGCPMNEFKTADNGKGKACKNIRRLALLPAQPLEVDGLKKSEVAYLKVPVTSGKSWAAYVRMLSTLERLPPAGVVTTLSAKSHSKDQFHLTFDMAARLPDAALEAVMSRYDDIAAGIDFSYPDAPEEKEAPAAKRPAAKKKY